VSGASTGQVIRRDSGTWALRFRAYGVRRYVTLGTSADGWTYAAAYTELQNTLADVRRGIWSPVKPEPERTGREDPAFREFALGWLDEHRGEWQPKTVKDYEWQLREHLLPFFGEHRLTQITIAEIDRYKHLKVAEAVALRAAITEGDRPVCEYTDRRGRRRWRLRRPLSARSINRTIGRLSQILDVAVEYGLIDANRARGRRRRVHAEPPRPVWLDRAEQIEALLRSAGGLDEKAACSGGLDHRGGLVYRRALIATLVFAGVRIGELPELQWWDIDFASSRIRIREAKTPAGIREIDLLLPLRKALTAHRAQTCNGGSDAYVFPSSTGTQISQENIRGRVLRPAVAQASARLGQAGRQPLPIGITPQKLRHTFASILFAIGRDPGTVMDQLGHVDPAFTLRVYRHSMRRDPGERERLAALVKGGVPPSPNSSCTSSRVPRILT
jgi:integrase